MNDKKKMLDDLDNVFSTKSFSKTVKQEIRDVLILAWDVEEDKKIFFDIIEGLKDIDVFLINSKKKLLKSKKLDKKSLDTCVGYVSKKDKLIVITKNEQLKSTIYHELIHLTQPDEAYYISPGYPFSMMFQKALSEGEATEHEIKFTKRYFPDRLMHDEYILLDNDTTHSIKYRIYHEIYSDIKSLFSKELLEEWKQNTSEDLIPKMGDFISEKYHISFPILYNLWISILYQYFSIFEEDEQELKNLSLEQKMLKLWGERNDDIIKIEKMYEELLESLKRSKTHYENILSSSENIKIAFQIFLAEQKQDLKKYIQEYGIDDTSKKWNREIKNVTLVDYQKKLEDNLKEIEAKINNAEKEFLETQLEYRKLEYKKQFYSHCSLEADLVEITYQKNILFCMLTGNRKVANSWYYAYLLKNHEKEFSFEKLYSKR